MELKAKKERVESMGFINKKYIPPLKDRVCKDCDKNFFGDRNFCPQCRYKREKAVGKFGAEYHRTYYHRFLSASSKFRQRKRTKNNELRTIALAKASSRIAAEITAIRSVGLHPSEASVREIINKGVVLDNSITVKTLMKERQKT